MKALLFSDLHLHAHRSNSHRLHDCLKVLDWAFSEAKRHDCRYVLFLGDLFHDRGKIDVLNYLRTFEIFHKHVENSLMDVYLIVGNHDMYHLQSWDVNSVKPLTAFPNVHMIDKPSTVRLGLRNVDFMPYTENPLLDLDKLKVGRNTTDLTLLLGHLAVHGAMLNMTYGTRADVVVEYDTGMMPVDASIFNDWNQTFLGHYHGAQKLKDNVEYIGSPLQLSFGEAFQEKHLIVLDLDTLEKTYIQNNFSPKHLILRKDQLELFDLGGQFVRMVCDEKTSAKDVSDMKLYLAEHKAAYIDFDQKTKDVEEDTLEITAARSILFKQDEMTKKWVEEAGVPEGLDKATLLKFGDEIIETAEDVEVTIEESSDDEDDG